MPIQTRDVGKLQLGANLSISIYFITVQLDQVTPLQSFVAFVFGGVVVAFVVTILIVL